MDESLRPDLSRILPMPILRRLAGHEPRLAQAYTPSTTAASPDFLVAVKKAVDHDASAPGFGIAQARAVAERIAAIWQRTHLDVAQRPDAGRSRPLLAGTRASERD